MDCGVRRRSRRLRRHGLIRLAGACLQGSTQGADGGFSRRDQALMVSAGHGCGHRHGRRCQRLVPGDGMRRTGRKRVRRGGGRAGRRRGGQRHCAGLCTAGGVCGRRDVGGPPVRGRCIQPVALALEGVGGQRDAAALGRGEAGRRQAIQTPQPGMGAGKRPHLVIGRLQAGDAGWRLPGGGGTAHQVGQNAAGTDFQEDAVGAFGQDMLHGIGKAHGVAQLRSPPVRVGGLGIGQRSAGPARGDGDGRDRQTDPGHGPLEGRDGRLHHGRMEGVRGLQPLVGDAFGFQLPCQRFNGGFGAGYHAGFGRIDGGDRQLRRQSRRDLGSGLAYGQHGTGRQGLNELATQGNQPGSIGHRHHARNDGGREFAQAVTHQQVGQKPLVLPPAGQCVFDGKEGRLGQRRLGQLGFAAVKDQRAQVGTPLAGIGQRGCARLGRMSAGGMVVRT